MESNFVLQSLVKTYLEKTITPISTRDLVKTIRETGTVTYSDINLKSQINKILYDMLKRKEICKIDSSPPKWTIKTIDNNKGDISTLVFIDADNFHCLDKAEKYASDDIMLVCYGSPGYNHYVPENGDHFIFKKLEKGEVIVTICINITESCLERKNAEIPLNIIIASKDKLCEHIASIINKKYKNIEIVIVNSGNWDDLQSYLE